MKFLRIMFLSTLFVLCCHGLSIAQNKINPYALVRVFESPIAGVTGWIDISYENGDKERIILPVMTKSSVTDEGSWLEIDGIILKTLNQMVSKGYRIIDVSYNSQKTTYVMEKIE